MFLDVLDVLDVLNRKSAARSAPLRLCSCCCCAAAAAVGCCCCCCCYCWMLLAAAAGVGCWLLAAAAAAADGNRQSLCVHVYHHDVEHASLGPDPEAPPRLVDRIRDLNHLVQGNLEPALHVNFNKLCVPKPTSYFVVSGQIQFSAMECGIHLHHRFQLRG
jgi:hypothetical protein